MFHFLLCIVLSSVTLVRADFDDKAKGAFFGALVADSLSLCTHYEYDAVKIKKFYGSIDEYLAPGEKTGGMTHGVGWGARNYHGGNGNGPAKRAGEQTDYGDYNILILEHLAATSEKPRQIELKELLPRWENALKTWRSWICTQTKLTFRQLKQGTPHKKLGGNSNAMGIRIAGAYGYYSTEKEIVNAARTAMFTHRENTAHMGNEFFARVTYRVIHNGLKPVEAIKEVAKESSRWIKDKVKLALDKAKQAMDSDDPLSKEEFVDDLALTSMGRLWEVGKTEPIKVGKASPTEGTLPGSIYFITKYEDDFFGAIQANAMVGGDNASRAIAIGMVLGAYHGMSAIPENLGRGNLVEWDKCDKLLNKLPLIRAKEEL